MNVCKCVSRTTCLYRSNCQTFQFGAVQQRVNLWISKTRSKENIACGCEIGGGRGAPSALEHEGPQRVRGGALEEGATWIGPTLGIFIYYHIYLYLYSKIYEHNISTYTDLSNKQYIYKNVSNKISTKNTYRKCWTLMIWLFNPKIGFDTAENGPSRLWVVEVPLAFILNVFSLSNQKGVSF